MRLLFLFVLITLAGCSTVAPLTYTVPAQPLEPLQPPAQKIVVLSTVDATQYSHRKNKEELVARITDSLVKGVSQQLQQAGIQAEAIYGQTPIYTTADGASIRALISKHNASHAIVMKEADLFFDQTDVQVTRTQSGKEREAFYDICANMIYEIYDSVEKLQIVPIRLRRFHSSRSVASGLLAFGPSLASNSKSFFALANETRDAFMSRFFPIHITRTRTLFSDGPFRNVALAAKQKNWEKALAESLRLTESRSRATAAMAWYNSAVLAERQQNTETAYLYLQRSLSAMRTPQALAMMESMQ